jgi:menaquinone-specific isochorismate synthase
VDSGADDRVPRLTVVTREVGDLGELLPYAERFDPLVFLRRGDGIVGLGNAFGYGGPLAGASEIWRGVAEAAAVDDPVGLPGSGLVAFGSFPFAPGGLEGRLIVPSTIIGRRNGRSWVTRATLQSDAPSFPAQSEPHEAPLTSPIDRGAAVEFVPGAMSPVAFQAAVATVVARIRAGDVGKVVLARDVVAELAEGADLRHPLSRLAHDYPDAVTFAVDGLLGATPETLVRVQGGRVTARVLAGTAARGVDATADAAVSLTLLGSRKDRDEHGLARSSVVAALRPQAADLEAGEPFTLELPNLWHLATDLHGTLDGGANALDLVHALHPTAAVGGTPTDRAVAAIAELEPFDRGRYAGPVGWIDGSGSGEWAIALRCAQVRDDGTVTAYAGAGIVADSVPAQELAETELKLRPIVGAFAG